MAKLFIVYAVCPEISQWTDLGLTTRFSGLAWHTTDETLTEGFAPFGTVEEAVSAITSWYTPARLTRHILGRRQG